MTARSARTRGAVDGPWSPAGRIARFLVLARLLPVAVAGCTGAATEAGPTPPAEPADAVELFLEAAGRRDHAAMARLFGTGDGPIGDRGGTLGCALRKAGSWIRLGARCLEQGEIELRMDVIAGILRHESYRVRLGGAVAGRGRAAIRVDVELEREGRGAVEVPFVVIRTGNGAWLVEQVGLDRVVG